jgi:hypothetical protein
MKGESITSVPFLDIRNLLVVKVRRKLTADAILIDER